MCLVFSLIIAITCTATRTNAGPPNTDIEMTVFKAEPSTSSGVSLGGPRRKNLEDYRIVVDENSEECLELLDKDRDAQRKEALDLVVDRFKKFSAEYLRIWGSIRSTYVLSPIIEFLSLLTYPYGKEEIIRSKVMEGLGFANHDPRIVQLGVQALIDGIDLTCPEIVSHKRHQTQVPTERPMKIFQRIRYHLSKLSKVVTPRPSMNDDFVNPISGCAAWDIKFDALYSEIRPFYASDDETSETESMYINGVFRHGELAKFNASFVEVGPEKVNGQSNNSSIFVILPGDQRGYRPLLNQLGEIVVEELVDYSKENVNLYIPKFGTKLNYTVNSWAPRFFKSANPFGLEDEVSADRDPASSEFSVDDFSRIFAVEIDDQLDDITWAASRIIDKLRASREGIVFDVNRPFAMIIAATGAIKIPLVAIAVDGRWKS